jgi:hypothetical protein
VEVVWQEEDSPGLMNCKGGQNKVAKRSFALVLVVSFIIAALAGVIVPKAAQADVTTYNWAETAYRGYDSFYANNVVAYETGSTAKLTATVFNNTAGTADITVREAKIKFDWGQEYAATSYPTEIRDNESGVVTFGFDVPSTDVASNATLHSYQIIVGYQQQGVSYQRYASAGDWLGNGNGINVDFFTSSAPVVPGSMAITFVDLAAQTVTAVGAAAYSVNPYTGKVSFVSAPASGIQVWAAYSYPELLGFGNGVNTVFVAGARPVVAGSQRVFLMNTVTQTVTEQAAAAYAFVAETGEVTFVTPPTQWQQVYAFYEYYSRFPVVTGANFAVYSADQASARQLKQEYTNLYRPTNFIPSAEGSQLIVEGDAQEALGDTAYANGDFSGAATYYQNAIDKMTAAIAADTGVNSTIEDALTGLGTGAAAWLDGQAAKTDAEANRIEALTDAEAKKLNAEAGFNDLYGVFLILIGVAGVLGAAGAIVWAVSRLVAAKRM